MNIKETLRLHKLWLKNDPEGAKANLREADLSGANLSEADLRGADLRGADLRGADLSEAYLSGANLSGAYLSRADLSGADLRGANLRNAIGNSKEIKTIQTDIYTVNITKDIVFIGCERHPWDKWLSFDDEQIKAMDGQEALDFWARYKDCIQLYIQG